ncbi:MAG TPA: tyrosine-type recombinase/integrase [Gemmatimonadaceae bacterium]|nr:tyrosine-type recombinase/integrase [Gemmatimonadaceae bacterium]
MPTLADSLAVAIDPVELARRAEIEPDRRQVELLRTNERQIIVNGTRQWGKSTVAGLLERRIKTLRRPFASAAKRAGVQQGFRQHDLRHRLVTLRADAGEPIQDVQYEAGHAQITTRMLYYKKTPVHRRRALVEKTTELRLASVSGA